MSNITEFLAELRTLGVDKEIDAEGRKALSSYCKYLLDPPDKNDYADLHMFLTWFGNKYISNKVIDWVQYLKYHLAIGTAYDMGCGTGWLGSSIKNETGLTVIGVDKRQNSVVNLDSYWTYDLENPAGFNSFESRFTTRNKTLKKSAVFIGSHFLHCIDNWVDVLQTFKVPWIIIEPTLISTDEPYGKQLKLFGAEPLSEKDIEQTFLSNGYCIWKKEYVEDQTLWVFLQTELKK